jgi:hypothetical protein
MHNHVLKSLAASFLFTAIALAHPPEKKPTLSNGKPAPSNGAANRPSTPQWPSGLVLPAVEGPAPWTEKPLLNDPSRFQIVIMTDNTGGHRPGIWQKAVERVNWLRPEFVMSVGDLIEGYSTDRVKVEAEWKQFLGFMDKMKMKFFFVAGNHDVSNPLMHKIWREHFGPEWYSFDYKGVHFVCLSSDDPETKIGDKQLAWLDEDLAKNAAARWTLIFLHKPLWVEAERAIRAGNPDKTNWKKVETMLGRRPHTVFSGHVHYYAQYDRNGMKYYHFATTGGSSQMRGVPYGEFDHVAWLTMEQDGPHVANLMLDGIFPADVVTEPSIARFRDFLAKTRIEVAPILLDDDSGFSQGRIDLRVTNGFDRPIELIGKIDGLPLRGLAVEPAALRLEAQPGKTAELAVTVQFREKISFVHLAQSLLTAKIRTLEKEKPLFAERTLPVIIDRKFPVPRRTDIAIDGNLDEWKGLRHETLRPAVVLGAAQNWQGPSDASVTLDVAADDSFLYIAVHVADDILLDADELELRLDARNIIDRRNDPKLGRGAYSFRVSAPREDEKSRAAAFTPAVKPYAKKVPAVKTAKSAARRHGKGYDVELAIPADVLHRYQKPWRSFSLTAVAHDIDEPNQPASKVVWRGTDAAEERNTNYGQFLRDK